MKSEYSARQVGFDLAYNAGNMLPSMAVGTINPVASAIVQGSSAAGTAYTSMINQGYSKEQAGAYGTLVGLSEGGLQYLFGGLDALGGNLSTKAMAKLLGKINNVYLKIGVKFGGKLLFEGGEEWLQTSLERYYRNIALMEEKEINLLSEDAIYNGMLGAMTAGLENGLSSYGKLLYGYQGYKNNNEKAKLYNFVKVKLIENLGEKGIINIPPSKIDTTTFRFKDNHASHHGCTEQEARYYIDNAKCSITRKRWDGVSENYYSADGATYVDLQSGLIKTSFSKDKFDKKTKAMMEVLK